MIEHSRFVHVRSDYIIRAIFARTQVALCLATQIEGSPCRLVRYRYCAISGVHSSFPFYPFGHRPLVRHIPTSLLLSIPEYSTCMHPLVRSRNPLNALLRRTPAVGTIVVEKTLRRMMDREQRDKADRQDEDPQAFDKAGRKVREGQSPQVGEEGTEEDRRQWKKTRDLHEEAKQISEKADARHRKGQED